MFRCFLLLLLCLPPIRTRSGIYVDNGLGQTIMDLEVSEDERLELEARLREFLGIPEGRPRASADPFGRAAPKFLMDVYRSLMEDEDGGRRKRNLGLDLSREEQSAIDVSDLIVTLESVESQVSGVRHEKGKRLWFNTSEIPLSEGIIGAELRIYQDGNFAKKHKKQQYSVSAFQLTKTDEGENELEYVSSASTTTTFTGWLRVNLTNCVKKWVASPKSNDGVYLSVHPTSRPTHEIKPEDIGLMTPKAENLKRPFVVAFLKNKEDVVTQPIGNIYHRRSKRYTAYSVDAFRNRDPYSGQEMRMCSVHTLYVDFGTLNWSDWIIAPAGFPANYCYGRCDFPLNAHVNATNHAIVQSMMHVMIDHLEYPKPCCAPMKLYPISFLIYTEDNSVTLKTFKNIIVKNCGCH